MKTPLTTRTAAFVLSVFTTLMCVQVIADYAYPEPAGARMVLASSR